ncbi:S8 family peptidase [Clostridium sp. D53t1_180928_C8]|uniref:S8 family peptidase n=1 Tax=Clostridium sp. D53t1_180928_C8 TaxID=2787101 RepID=UPI0018A947C8|nr:S8 family peptidase [Clostridium sp. D53t1_180928_C8]
MVTEEMVLTEYSYVSKDSIANGVPDGIKIIGAPEFWRKGHWGEGVTIAVIDTGCDINHQNLKDRIIGVRNFTDEDNGDVNIVNDYVGHGTHVAGIIAASDIGNGIIGVAPKANLLILKALGAKGGNYFTVTNAIDYAINSKVDIISMSLGGKVDDDQLHKSIKNAVNKGILVVCAVGNDGDNNSESMEINYPAMYSEVISVGSINSDKKSSIFSASNNEIDLVAPGQGIGNSGIISTAPSGRFAEMQGTSMATPHVAGALALIINWAKDEFKRKLTEVELYAQLIKKTVSLGYSKSIEGNGMLFLGADEIISRVLKNNKLFNELTNELIKQ